MNSYGLNPTIEQQPLLHNPLCTKGCAWRIQSARCRSPGSWQTHSRPLDCKKEKNLSENAAPHATTKTSGSMLPTHAFYTALGDAGLGHSCWPLKAHFISCSLFLLIRSVATENSYYVPHRQLTPFGDFTCPFTSNITTSWFRRHDCIYPGTTLAFTECLRVTHSFPKDCKVVLPP